MKLRFLLIYIAFVLAVGIAGYYVIVGGRLSDDIPVHTIEINRLLVSLEENWEETMEDVDIEIDQGS